MRFGRRLESCRSVEGGFPDGSFRGRVNGTFPTV
jgi:hypothetical protein